MDCMSVRGQMHAYLDQELDLPSVAAIDRHLASCPACKAAFAQLSALKSGLRKHAVRHSAPAALAERIRAGVAASAAGTRTETPAPLRRAPWFQHWLQLGGAFAAASVMTWTAATLYYASAQDDLIAEQVFSAHARSVLTDRLSDVASSDQHTVKPWLSSKLDFSPPVADLAGAGFPLVGGRVDYVNSRPVAALVYRHRQHWIDLFVWPDAKSSRASPEALAKNGFNVLRWTDAGMTFWAISDVNAAELKTFAEAYRK
jgi:anti-sigma factor RsiW